MKSSIYLETYDFATFLSQFQEAVKDGYTVNVSDINIYPSSVAGRFFCEMQAPETPKVAAPAPIAPETVQEPVKEEEKTEAPKRGRKAAV